MEFGLGKVSCSQTKESQTSYPSICEVNGLASSVTQSVQLNSSQFLTFLTHCGLFTTYYKAQSPVYCSDNYHTSTLKFFPISTQENLYYSKKPDSQPCQLTLNCQNNNNIPTSHKNDSKLFRDIFYPNQNSVGPRNNYMFWVRAKSPTPSFPRALPSERLRDALVILPLACVAFVPMMVGRYLSPKSQSFTTTQSGEGMVSSNTQASYKSFCAGAIAGVVSRTSTAPLERLKILYQVNYDGIRKTPNVLTGLKQIYITDGFAGFFRGNTLSVLKATPFSAIRFTVFEQMKKILAQRNAPNQALTKVDMFIAGAIAGFASNLAIYPMEVVRVRMTAAPQGTYAGVCDAFLKIQRTEGRFLPFYRGITASLCSTMPNSGLNLMTYEFLKKLVIGQDTRKEPHALVSMAVGSTSALISSTLLYPFTVIGSRLIMQGAKVNVPQDRSLKTLVTTIYKSEGFRGFYKGYMPGITKIVLGNGISFATYESMKRRLA